MDREKLAQAQQLGELQTALAVCRKNMVQEVMADSQGVGLSGVVSDQPQTHDKSFVPL